MYYIVHVAIPIATEIPLANITSIEYPTLPLKTNMCFVVDVAVVVRVGKVVRIVKVIQVVKLYRLSRSLSCVYSFYVYTYIHTYIHIYIYI